MNPQYKNQKNWECEMNETANGSSASSAVESDIVRDAPTFTLGVGSVIGRSFKILFRNFAPFFLLSLLILLPSTLIEVYAPDYVGAELTNFVPLLVLPVHILLGAVLSGVLAYGTFMDLNNEDVSFFNILGNGLSFVLPVIGVAVISFVCVMLGMIVFIVPGLIVAMMLFVAVPVTVVEKTDIFGSLGRSSFLTKGNRWRVFGIYIIGVLLMSFIGGFFGGLIGGVGGAMDADMSVINPLVSLIVTGVVSAYYGILVTVTYHDLRVSKEGLDTRQLAAVFD
jgi:hypothetical protein